MRKIGLAAIVVLAAAVGVATGAGGNDKDKLQGTWTLTAMNYAGKEQPLPKDKQVTITFKGDSVAFKEGKGKAEEGTFKIDASKSPKHLDMNKGKGAKDEDKAIYALEGDTLKIGLGGDGKGGPSTRPTAFDDANCVTLIFKKAAK